MPTYALHSAEDVVKNMSVQDYQGVYVLGSLDRPLTFYSQQIRAFNLIWALAKTKSIHADSCIAVVGGGLAGLTVASAALLKGCRVVLLERREQILTVQKRCLERFVHPRIIDWPHRDSLKRYTSLPCLNWQANTAGIVASEIEAQWNDVTARYSSQLKTIFNCGEITIDRSENGVPARLLCPAVFPAEAFTAIILSVGFGWEKVLPDIRCQSYWANDSYSQPVKSKKIPRDYLVSGCGDGGLIDYLRLTIEQFHQENFAQMATNLFPRATRRRLIDLDQHAQLLDRDAATRFLREEYRALPIGSSILDEFRARFRRDTQVVLNDLPPQPFLREASLVNRMGIEILDRLGLLNYRGGSVSIESLPPGQVVRAHITNGDALWVGDFDEVVVRHGADSSLQQYFPRIYDRCRRRFRSQPALPANHFRLFTNSFFPSPIEWRRPIPVDSQSQQMPANRGDPHTFFDGDYTIRRATYDNIRWISQEGVDTYGPDTIPHEIKKRWYLQNPNGFWVILKDRPYPDSIIEVLPLTSAGLKLVKSRSFREVDLKPEHIAAPGVFDSPSGYRNLYIENIYNVRHGLEFGAMMLALRFARTILFSIPADAKTNVFTMLTNHNLLQFVQSKLRFTLHGRTSQGYPMLRSTVAELLDGVDRYLADLHRRHRRRDDG